MSAWDAEQQAREDAVGRIEDAAGDALAALERLRDALASAHRAMPSRHVAARVGAPDATLRRWRIEVPPAGTLRQIVEYMAERRRAAP